MPILKAIALSILSLVMGIIALGAFPLIITGVVLEKVLRAYMSFAEKEKEKLIKGLKCKK